jgi:hypothetical protein
LANFGASSNSLATSLQLTPKSAGLDPQSTSRCPRKKTTAAACEKAVIQLEQQFQRIFADQHKNGRLDLEAVEMAIRSTVHQTGADAVTELLRWEPPDDTQRRMPCACGKEARYEGMRSRPILTVVGWARIERPYYLCPACKTGQFPADVQLDIDKTDFSPGVRRMLAAVGSETAFAPGRDQMKLLAGLAVTAKAVERTAESIGRDMEARQQAEIRRAKQLHLPVVADPPIPYLYVQMDGTQVFMVKAETEGRSRRTPGRPARSRECKLGAVFTQTTVDEQGRPVRDEHSTTYVGAIESAEEFGLRLYTEAWNRGLGSRRRPRRYGGWLSLDLEYCRAALPRRYSNRRSLSCSRTSLGVSSPVVSGR